MEAFQLLSRGGLFNKSRFQSDVQLFNASTPFKSTQVFIDQGFQETAEKIAPQAQPVSALPPSLDFFKYAKRSGQSGTGSTSIMSATHGVRDGEEERQLGEKRPRSEDEEDRPSFAPALRHKVTAKGQRIPAEARTFEDMAQRFKIPSYVMKNIVTCRYSVPTAIQRVGIPILAEVVVQPTLSVYIRPNLRHLGSRYRRYIPDRNWQNTHLPSATFLEAGVAGCEVQHQVRTRRSCINYCTYTGASCADLQ